MTRMTSLLLLGSVKAEPVTPKKEVVKRKIESDDDDDEDNTNLAERAWKSTGGAAICHHSSSLSLRKSGVLWILLIWKSTLDLEEYSVQVKELDQELEKFKVGFTVVLHEL